MSKNKFRLIEIAEPHKGETPFWVIKKWNGNDWRQWFREKGDCLVSNHAYFNKEAALKAFDYFTGKIKIQYKIIKTNE